MIENLRAGRFLLICFWMEEEEGRFCWVLHHGKMIGVSGCFFLFLWRLYGLLMRKGVSSGRNR